MAVHTYTEQLDTFYTTTWQHRQKEIVDSIYTATPFWYYITAKKRTKAIRGGRFLEFPIQYNKSPNVAGYGKGDTVGTSDIDPITVAKYDWKYVVGSILRFGIDDQQNSGKAQHINMANAKMDNVQDAITDYFETVMFGDGTGSGGKDPDGLLHLLADDNTTGTVGGIPRNVNTWWRHIVNASSGAFTLFGISDMRTLYNDCSNGGQTFPDIFITTQAIHERYEDEGLEYYQFSDRKLVDLGFTALKFKGAVVTWMPSCTAQHIYAINTKRLFWVYDPQMNGEMTPWKAIPNQVNDRVAQIIFAGNLVGTEFRVQGLIPDSAT